MRRHIVFAAVSALSLAACGSADDSGAPLSEDEVAERFEEANRLEPGQYRSTVELVSLDMPGAPAEVTEMMKQSMSGNNATTEYCLTKEEAEKGYEAMAKNSAQGDCDVQRFDVDGGDIDALMVCKSPDGSQGTITMKGTGGRTSSDMTMTIKTDVRGMGKSTMVMRTQHQRIGDCAT